MAEIKALESNPTLMLGMARDNAARRIALQQETVQRGMAKEMHEMMETLQQLYLMSTKREIKETLISG